MRSYSLPQIHILVLPVLLAACARTSAPPKAPVPSAPESPQKIPAKADAEESPKTSETPLAANLLAGESPAPSLPSLPPPAAVDKALDCKGGDLFGPSHARQHVFDTRYGVGAANFSQVPTTPSAPIEACGLDAALFTLSDLRCDAGERPYNNRQGAHRSRRGSIGAGGRCGAIIDLYEVPCPEKTYEVHVDMYFCGPE